jgi:hypothetical protein
MHMSDGSRHDMGSQILRVCGTSTTAALWWLSPEISLTLRIQVAKVCNTRITPLNGNHNPTLVCATSGQIYSDWLFTVVVEQVYTRVWNP